MNAILDLPEIRARVHVWTVAEYEKLGDDPAFRRTELIRGMIVNKMSKSPLHSTVASQFHGWLLQKLPPGWCVRKEEPLRLRDSMPEPDLAVLRGTLRDYAARHPTTAEWVVEVAVSSVGPDRENAAVYAEAGVPEYWVVLAEREQVEVYRRPEEGVYMDRRTYRRGETVEAVAALGGPCTVDTLFASAVS